MQHPLTIPSVHPSIHYLHYCVRHWLEDSSSILLLLWIHHHIIDDLFAFVPRVPIFFLGGVDWSIFLIPIFSLFCYIFPPLCVCDNPPQNRHYCTQQQTESIRIASGTGVAIQVVLLPFRDPAMYAAPTEEQQASGAWTPVARRPSSTRTNVFRRTRVVKWRELTGLEHLADGAMCSCYTAELDGVVVVVKKPSHKSNEVRFVCVSYGWRASDAERWW